MPRSPSTVRVTGVVATTSRERFASSGSSSTTECTSVVAPPTSTTTTSPTPGRSRRASRQQLDAGEHDVGRRAGDHRGEVGALAEVLAADHVGQEHRADRGTGGVRGEHADAGHHVVGDDVRVVLQCLFYLGPGVHVAGDDDGAGPAAGDDAPGRIDDHLGVAAVGPARQQHHVRPGRVPQAAPERCVRHTTRCGDDLDHAAAAGERDPAAGLGGDQLLVADHGDPQATSGAGAGEHLGVVGPGILLAEGGQAGVVPVEHVGLDRRRVRRLGHDPALGQVDQGRLGEGGAEVDADRAGLSVTGSRDGR